MVAEKKRMESRGESLGVPKQKWLENRKKIGKLLDSNGFICKKHTCLRHNRKYKKWEKEPIPHGWDDEVISLDMSDWDMMLYDQFDILFF
jgi:pre-mRNA-splicing factor SYF2